MAIINTLTFAGLGYIVRFGQCTLAGTPGTFTETDALAGFDEFYIGVSRYTAAGTLGNLNAVDSGADLVLNSDANETSVVNWWILGTPS